MTVTGIDWYQRRMNRHFSPTSLALHRLRILNRPLRRASDFLINLKVVDVATLVVAKITVKMRLHEFLDASAEEDARDCDPPFRVYP